MVGVSGSLNSLGALRYGVSEVRANGGALWAVPAWSPPGGEVGGRSAPPRVLVQERDSAADRRLRTAFDQTFGGVPDDLEVGLVVWRGRPAPALVGAAGLASDLLVLGPRRRWPRLPWSVSVAGQCSRLAICPLVVIPPPPLAGLVGRRVRRTAGDGPSSLTVSGRARARERPTPRSGRGW